MQRFDALAMIGLLIGAPAAFASQAKAKPAPARRGVLVRFARMFLGAVLVAAPVFADEVPIARLASVRFAVANLDKARQFYTELLGFEEAFGLKDDGGQVESALFKVNDDQ